MAPPKGLVGASRGVWAVRPAPRGRARLRHGGVAGPRVRRIPGSARKFHVKRIWTRSDVFTCSGRGGGTTGAPLGVTPILAAAAPRPRPSGPASITFTPTRRPSWPWAAQTTGAPLGVGPPTAAAAPRLRSSGPASLTFAPAMGPLWPRAAQTTGAPLGVTPPLAAAAPRLRSSGPRRSHLRPQGHMLGSPLRGRPFSTTVLPRSIVDLYSGRSAGAALPG